MQKYSCRRSLRAASNLSQNTNSMRMRMRACVHGFVRCAAASFSAIRCEEDILHIYVFEREKLKLGHLY
jgi:hypothetical protein